VARGCGDSAGRSKVSGFRRLDELLHRFEWVWIFGLADERQEAFLYQAIGKRDDIPAAGDVLEEQGLLGIGEGSEVTALRKA
jgi:hypothetical protein